MGANEETTILTEPVKSAKCPKCGSMLDVDGLPAFTPVQCPSCSEEFRVPAKFGPFLLLSPLGSGGMGGVYRAKDEALNRDVAVKVMLKSLGDDPQFVETFQREAQAAAKLNHPNIAQIYTFALEKGQPYIAMELVAGGGLDKMMEKGTQMDPAYVIKIGEQIARGLKEAADAGLVHGDVKPENILFDADKNAKLVDFGLAALTDSSGAEGEIWGTPYYISPEKVRRQKCDFRADIYSLGGTLYHAIAGIPPFDGKDAAEVVKARFQGPPIPLKQLIPGIPVEVDEMISRMLELEPAKRYPTYESLLSDMQRFLKSQSPSKMKSHGKKIVIKGSTAASHASGAKKSFTVSSSSRPPVETAPLTQPDNSADQNRGCRIMAMIGGGIILVALLLGGGIWGYMAHAKKSEMLANFNQSAQVQEKIRGAISGYISKTDEWVKKVESLPGEAMGYAKSALEVAVAAIGEERRKDMIPPEPDYKAMAGTQKKGAPKGKAKAAGTNGTDKVSGTLSNAVPDRVEAPKPVEESPSVPAGDDSSAPIIKRVRGLYQDAYEIKGLLLFAQNIRKEIGELAASADQVTVQQVPSEQAIAIMKQGEAQLLEINQKLDVKFRELSGSRKMMEAASRVANMKKAIDSLKSDVETLRQIREQKRLEEEKKAREEAAEAKKAEEAEAHKEQVQADYSTVKNVEGECVAYLKKLNFKAASRILRDLDDELKTKEGLAALETALTRLKRIEGFHNFLVENCAKGYKSPRRWEITDANKRHMLVNGKNQAWVDVYVKQPQVINELINEFVMGQKAVKRMRLRERTQRMTDAALFLRVFYGDIASASKWANELAKKAAELFQADAENIRELVPEAFE